MLIYKNLSILIPPTKFVNLDRFFTFALIADSAIINKLHAAANAPTSIKHRPSTHPLSPSTYGSDRTPDPIADAHSENMLPLSDPLSSFPNALFAKFLLVS